MSKLTQCITNEAEKSKAINEADQYRVLFERFLREKREIDWSKVKNVPDEVLLPYKNLEAAVDDVARKELLDKLIVVKLNGGLGTSMGCKGPKSLISVRSGMNFLDLRFWVVRNFFWKKTNFFYFFFVFLTPFIRPANRIPQQKIQHLSPTSPHEFLQHRRRHRPNPQKIRDQFRPHQMLQPAPIPQNQQRNFTPSAHPAQRRQSRLVPTRPRWYL